MRPARPLIGTFGCSRRLIAAIRRKGDVQRLTKPRRPERAIASASAKPTVAIGVAVVFQPVGDSAARNSRSMG